MKKDLYKLALDNVHKYSLLNEIFAIRNKKIEKEDYTIGVTGFISVDVLKRYVRNIDELVKYQNIGTIKKLEQLESDWNELKKWLEEEIYNIEPKGTGINFNCEYDSEEDYIRAMKVQSKLITLKRILIQMQELEGKNGFMDKKSR